MTSQDQAPRRRDPDDPVVVEDPDVEPTERGPEPFNKSDTTHEATQAGPGSEPPD
jgi:hypothetical protein